VKPLWILGAGGHARIVIDTARSSGEFEVCGVLDDRATPGQAEVDGVPMIGSICRDTVERHRVTHAIVAIGDARLRAAVAKRMDGLVRWATVVHQRSCVAGNVTVGVGTLICAGAVVQPGAVVGDHVILNTSCSVDHDNVIADLVQIAPGAHLGGTVTVGEGTFVGIGASVLPGVAIGAWSMIGAGAAVIRDVPSYVTAVGVPARVIAERESVDRER
jgi:sugar O-acyltransferase (sialic acid O-acetyltransferase NeuD family)